ncbi:MAG: maleylpyruvate isomerase family mycothiol-dependent enzyme [Ilumatobacteraceae bacterium]
MRLLEAELQLTIDVLAQLGPAEWTAQTACPDWDVRRMYLHVLGACEGSASVREGLHQLRVANKRRRADGGALEANLSAVQVAERESIDAVQLVEALRKVAPKTVKARKRLPGFIRRWAKVSVDSPVVEKWTIGYLVDTIYLRDLWMHRLDATDATGRSPSFSAEHDGRIVANVVSEWARRHGQPFTLELTGAAGGKFANGRYVNGNGGESIVIDAAEFCRVMSGRAPGVGLLATAVPF